LTPPASLRYTGTVTGGKGNATLCELERTNGLTSRGKD
jgi:hypothetical protein